MKQTEREQIRKDYIDMTEQSWTYEKMTEKEQITVIEFLQNCKLFANTEKNVYEELHNIYISFLYGLDYKENSTNWREKEN